MTSWRAASIALILALAAGSALAQGRSGPRNGDYILAVINQELVTAGELDRRLERVQQEAKRTGGALPPEPSLRQQVLDALIEERVIVTYARESGVKIDEADLDRAVQSVAAQNQISIPELRRRLSADGVDYTRFRANLRDQLLVERIREREVYQRIKVTDLDVERLVDQQRAAAQADSELNLAQILVSVPEGASAATVAARQERAEQALQRVRRGEDFATVAKEISEDANKDKGGAIGLRTASRLPDAFVDAVRSLAAGEVASTLLRTGAGFHVLKVVERREGAALRITQTRARHILLRTSAQLNAEAAARRLLDYRRDIDSGAKSFEDLARQFSDDSTASQGGDLGWASPGMFVPEFDEAMNKLAIGGISPPVVSRFGVHLIQVLERRESAMEDRQLREQARNLLREQKFEEAYLDWAKDLRARAYIEMREPPL